MYRDGARCPICGLGRINVDKKHQVFEYKGKKLTLLLTTYKCDVCNVEFFDNEEMLKYLPILKDFLGRREG
ncbi:YgiT-type zinc finger protein [Desulfonauticus submarinus]